MRGVRILEKTGFYLVIAGGHVYRLPKQYVEKRGDTMLVSRRTGYRTLTKLQALGLVMRNEAKQYIITDKGRQAIADVKQLLAKEMPVRG